jgi:hypothetical protein
VNRKSKASVQPANQQRHALMASAVHAHRVRPTVALNAAKAAVRQAVVAAIVVLLLDVESRVAVRQWPIVLRTPSALRSQRQNVRASSWSRETSHRASVAARQPVRASVRASVVASLSNR